MATTPSDTVHTVQPQLLSALPVEPLVSILLGNYNYAHYIGQSIESVLNQSYQKWELIICDDGSTDGSVSTIRPYLSTERRIKLVQKQNGGHTSALNSAFSVCSGDVVCLLDSDDLFLPKKLELLIKEYCRCPQAGLIIHRVVRVNQARKSEGVYPLSDYPDGWLGPDLVGSGGIIPCAPPTSGISLRREIADTLFPISIATPLHMCPDQVIMRVAPLLTALRRMPDALAEYRVHGKNAYSSQGVSLSGVTRQLEISRALWKEQRRVLFQMNPEIAERLADLEESPTTAMLQYVEAKLQKCPVARACLDKYLAVCKRHGEFKWLAFWRISIHLPNPIFRPAVNLLTGQGALKQFVSRLKKLA